MDSTAFTVFVWATFLSNLDKVQINAVLWCLRFLSACLLLLVLRWLTSKHEVDFYSSQLSTNILSGQDGTLQSFSTVHEKFNKSLGRGKYFSECTNTGEQRPEKSLCKQKLGRPYFHFGCCMKTIHLTYSASSDVYRMYSQI